MTHIFLGNTKNANRTAAKDQKTTVETALALSHKFEFGGSFYSNICPGMCGIDR